MSELVVTVNGEPRRVPGPATLLDLLAHLGLDPRTVVVELNREIVRRRAAGRDDGGGRRLDRAGAFRRRGVSREAIIFSVVPTAIPKESTMTGTIAPDTLTDAPLTIGGRSFRSRLMVGTGKYRSNGDMVRAIEASGAEIVTVAVRRVDLDRTKEEGVLYHLSPDQYFLLANTAGCYSADEAVRYARLAREAGFNDFVKLEVIGDRETLLPDTEGLLAAARTLVRRGLPGPRLHQRRPDHRPPARGCGLRGGHAAGLADRQRARPGQSLQHPHDQAPALGAGRSSMPASAPRRTRASPWSRASTAS